MTEQERNLPPRQILVGGTAGRSSIATMIAAIIRAGGDNVLLVTDAWLHSPSEQLTLNGMQLDRDRLSDLGFASVPSDSAELTHLIALLVAQNAADWVVLSGVPPTPSAVATSVFAPFLPSPNLGAAEAAQAQLPALPPIAEIVSAPQRESVLDVLRPFANDRGVRLNEVALSCRLAREGAGLDGQQLRLKTDQAEYRLRLPLLGAFQVENAATAVLTAERVLQDQPASLQIQTSVRTALEAIRLPGRAELIKRRPLVFVDAASNAAELRRLIEAIQPFVRHGRLQAVVDGSHWDEVEEAARLLASFEAEIIAIGAPNPLWAPACAQADLPFRAAPTVEAAVEVLTEDPEGDAVAVFGSRAAAGAARSQVLGLLPADMRLN
jgi:folylpolyglutamate synthase/dihydropteroate synthase